MKKIQIAGLFVIILILIGVGIMIFSKDSSSRPVFEFILPERQENIEDYLFYYNSYEFYLKDYSSEETYILISEKGTKITEKIYEKAKEYIKKNKFELKDENKNNYRIIPLKKALYNFDVDVSWIEDRIPLKKNKIDNALNDIEVYQIDKSSDFKILYNNKNLNLKIYTNGYDFSFLYDEKKYKSLSDIEDINIEYFLEKMYLTYKIENSIQQISDDSYINVFKTNEIKIAIKRKIVNNKTEYYIYKYDE